MKLQVLRANPSGNITLYVLSPVDFDRKLRPRVAAKLIELLPNLAIEQVGFVCTPKQGALSRMEMAGGEFCGNATRAFGMLVACDRIEDNHVTIEVSGCEEPVTVDINWATHTARATMPLPREVRSVTILERPATLVHFGGIAHIIIDNINRPEGLEALPANRETFEAVEPLLSVIPGLEAWGVIFLSRENHEKDIRLTPIVRVPSVGTLVTEGSCASGTLAAAVAQCLGASGTTKGITSGEFCCDYLEPSGSILRASVTLRNGRITATHIEGPVEFDEPFEIEIEIEIEIEVIN